MILFHTLLISNRLHLCILSWCLDCSNLDAAFWRGEDTQTDPTGRDGYSGRSVLIHGDVWNVFTHKRWIFLRITYSHSLVSSERTRSTWRIMKEICAELGYRGLFAGAHSFCPVFSKNTVLSLSRSDSICVFLRFHAKGDQSRSSLRHHDKHIWVWKGLLP